MSSDTHIDLAKDYVEQSNAHGLSRILRMFHDAATYASPHVGRFSGREEAGETMKEFFGALHFSRSGFHRFFRRRRRRRFRGLQVAGMKRLDV